jgi:hypothetical protein
MRTPLCYLIIPMSLASIPLIDKCLRSRAIFCYFNHARISNIRTAWNAKSLHENTFSAILILHRCHWFLTISYIKYLRNRTTICYFNHARISNTNTEILCSLLIFTATVCYLDHARISEFTMRRFVYKFSILGPSEILIILTSVIMELVAIDKSSISLMTFSLAESNLCRYSYLDSLRISNTLVDSTLLS